MKLFRNFLLLLLAVPALAFAQVSFPNGVPDISVEDLSVKALTSSGRIRVAREWWEGQWHINLRWADAVMGGAGYGSLDCLNYPLMTIQGLTYKKNDIAPAIKV
ncbi:MAG: hypothetical protein FWG81_05995 [Betaproteobacteria bacterium]|nr:hypothetical protein [Betaproteobacteria bacterium]